MFLTLSYLTFTSLITGKVKLFTLVKPNADANCGYVLLDTVLFAFPKYKKVVPLIV